MANVVINPYTSTQPDGSTLQNDFTGASGEKLTANIHGQYYNISRRGALFIGSTAAAGTAFPASNSTSPTFGLWNTSTTHNAEILQFNIGYTSGTIALGVPGFAFVNAGYAVGTAAPLSAFNTTASRSGFIGSTSASKMAFTGAGTNTLTAALAAPYYWTGLSIESATAGTGVFTGVDYIDGKIILPPGYAMFLVNSVAQTGVFTMSLAWAEVPV